MRKRILWMMMALVMVFAVACGQGTPGATEFGSVDFEFEEEDYSDYGISMVLGKPTVWNDYAENVGLFPIENGQDVGLTIVVLPPSVLEGLNQVLSDENAAEEDVAAARQTVMSEMMFMGSFVITNNSDRLEELKADMDYAKGVVVETQEGGRSLLYLWNEPDLSQVAAEDKEMMEAVFAPAEELMKVARLADEPEGTAGEKASRPAGLQGLRHWSFKAVNLEGQEVTDAILAEHPLTMVNVWATFCGPCRQEMPELAQLYEDYGDRMGFLGIVGDATEIDEKEKELAQTIVKEYGVPYENVLANADLQDSVLKDVMGFPTTFFVNSEGDVVGEIIVGARNYEAFAAQIEALLKN